MGNQAEPFFHWIDDDVARRAEQLRALTEDTELLIQKCREAWRQARIIMDKCAADSARRSQARGATP